MFLGFGSKGKGRGKKRQAHQIEGGGAAGASCRRIRGSSSKASEKRRRKAVALAAKKEDALASAAYSGDLAAVKRLLAGGADADKGRNDEVGACPLASACVGGHTEIARALLKAGAYVNHTPVDMGMIDGAPLNCALGSLLRAEGGSIDLVKLLLAAGADPYTSGFAQCPQPNFGKDDPPDLISSDPDAHGHGHGHDRDSGGHEHVR